MPRKKSSDRSRRRQASHRRVHVPSGLAGRGSEDPEDLPDLTDEAIHRPHLILKVLSAAMAASEKIHKADDFEEVYERHLDGDRHCPYMSARAGVACILARLGRLDEAIEHFREMIDLNPFDHQGVRYIYLATLLDAGRTADAERLLATDVFADDDTAPVAYARALLAYRMEGPTERARELATAALGANTLVPEFLSGRTPLADELPPLGDDERSEAIRIALDQVMSWSMTRGALAWLKHLEEFPDVSAETPAVGDPVADSI